MRIANVLAAFLALIGLPSCGAGSDTSIDLFATQAAAPDAANVGEDADASSDTEVAADAAADAAVDAKEELAAPDSSICDSLECSGDQPYCNASVSACVACLVNSHCTGEHPWCSPQGSCVECLNDSQCQGSDAPKCLVSEGTCVECIDSSQCGSGSCSADHECSN